MRETWVQSLGREDPLEEGMATHSSVLAWRTPWTEGPGGLEPTESGRAGHDSVAPHSTVRPRMLASSLSLPLSLLLTHF